MQVQKKSISIRRAGFLYPSGFCKEGQIFGLACKTHWIAISVSLPLVLGWVLGIYNEPPNFLLVREKYSQERQTVLGKEIKINLDIGKPLRGFAVLQLPPNLVFDPKSGVLSGKLACLGPSDFRAASYGMKKIKENKISFLTTLPTDLNSLKDVYKNQKKFDYKKAYDGDFRTAWHSEVGPFPHFLLIDLEKPNDFNVLTIDQGYTQDSGYLAQEIDVYLIDEPKKPVLLGSAKNAKNGEIKIPLIKNVGKRLLLIGVKGPGPLSHEAWANRVWAVKEVRIK